MLTGLAITVLLAMAVLWYPSGLPFWYVSAAIAAAVLLSWRMFNGPRAPFPLEPWISRLIWIFMGYVAFQLVPLPAGLTGLLSPARGELHNAVAKAVSGAGFASLSVAPTLQWEHLWRVAGYAVVFLSMREIAARNSENRWRVAIPIMIVASFEAALGLFQYVSDTKLERAHGSLINPDHFSGFLEMALPFMAMYALLGIRDWKHHHEMTGTWRAPAGLALSFLMLLGITYSLSRIGLVAAATSLLVCLILALPRHWSWRARAATYAGIALVLVPAAFLLVPARLLTRASESANASGAVTDSRLGMWSDTLHMIASYPIFGSGLGTFGTAFLRYQTSDLEHAVIYAHNDYLQVAAETGFVGWLICTALSICVFRAVRGAVRNARRTRDRFVAIACVGAFAAILVHGLVDYNLYVQPNAILLACIAGIGASVRPRRSDEGGERVAPANPANPAKRQTLILAALLAAYSVASLVAAPAIKGRPELERRLCHFGFCNEETELTASFQQLAKPQTREQGIDTLRSMLRRDPASPQAWFNLGQAYATVNQEPLADFCFDRALLQSPNNPVALLRHASYIASRGRRERAIAESSRVLTFGPIFDNAFFSFLATNRASADDVIRAGGLRDCPGARRYFRHTLLERNAPNTTALWNWIIAHHCDDPESTAAYVNTLLARLQFEPALKIWVSHVGASPDGYPASNRLFNAEFDTRPSGCEFDWRNLDPTDVQFLSDPKNAHHGSGVLRAAYNGAVEPSIAAATQLVYLEPGRYRLRAWLRPQDMAGEFGMGFRAVDRFHPENLDAKTNYVTGTGDWQQVERSFTISGAATPVDIQLVRTSTGIEASKPAGTVWVDSVTLVREK